MSDELEQLRRERDALAVALDIAHKALDDAYTLVNDGSMVSKEWEVFKRVCRAMSTLNQHDHYAILAAHDASVRKPLLEALRQIDELRQQNLRVSFDGERTTHIWIDPTRLLFVQDVLARYDEEGREK